MTAQKEDLTARDGRILAAMQALTATAPKIVEADELYQMAVAVVDALTDRETS